MIKIAIVVGSTRPGRKAEAVAKWVYEIARKRDLVYPLCNGFRLTPGTSTSNDDCDLDHAFGVARSLREREGFTGSRGSFQTASRTEAPVQLSGWADTRQRARGLAIVALE